MNNKAAIKEQYLRDPLPIRLGGLAANLARVQSFSEHPKNRDVVKNIVEESKFFYRMDGARNHARSPN
ncbi:MAG TPA: hypothetical protein VFZ34_22905 [Blastocatellia bacterium]|nr:hypothetical protein [Blastocatellia bacterium]